MVVWRRRGGGENGIHGADVSTRARYPSSFRLRPVQTFELSVRVLLQVVLHGASDIAIERMRLLDGEAVDERSSEKKHVRNGTFQTLQDVFGFLS